MGDGDLIHGAFEVLTFSCHAIKSLKLVEIEKSFLFFLFYSWQEDMGPTYSLSARSSKTFSNKNLVQIGKKKFQPETRSVRIIIIIII
jgi:hypothetical protein